MQWLIQAENYVWRCKPMSADVDVVKNGEPVIVVPKRYLDDAEKRIRELQEK
jgi:hypothetical protein